MNKFTFTCGDTNGIGLEIIIKSLNKLYKSTDDYYIVCPQKIFLKNTSIVKPKFRYKFYKSFPKENSDKGIVKIINIPGGVISVAGPKRISGKISYTSLKVACKYVEENNSTALITAPISKEAWQLNSINYEGHTDYLGERYKVKNPLMLFYSKKMIAGLVTIHRPIKEVSKLITQKRLKAIIGDLRISLNRDFKKVNPKIAVLGLNPHAGENGRIGEEEIKKIAPAVSHFDNVEGPFVPDAFFGKKLFKNYDAVLGMYHDQILIPFKMMDFAKGVNFTANLPIVRTSPDHGTAYDIAYKGIADPSSMIEAIKLAKNVIRNRLLS